jgi:hypothetical protein
LTRLAALLVALPVTVLPPSVQPRPIGVGRAYHPGAAPPAVLAGRPVAGLRCAADRGGARFGVHLELFARRRVVVVPAGIGVARPFRHYLGRVVPAGCTYPARTRQPTGVIEIGPGARLTLGQLFALWGRRLGAHRLSSFSGGPVLAFVGGRRWRRDPRAIPLTRHAQIVLEIGGYVPPHPSYLFPGGL